MDSETIVALLAAATEPDFDGAKKCFDWRNHVPCGIHDMWTSLSLDARIVAILMAQEGADGEEWD